MKLNVLFLAVAGTALSAPALAAPTVYGKVNVSYDFITDDATDESVFELNSNASRLGFKGSEKISDALSVIYKAEFEISVDDGDKKDQVFAQRNIFGGLKGGFGSVRFGMFDTPLKVSQGKFDLFNDVIDIKSEIEGENRVANQINYTTPAFADVFSVSLSIITGEDSADGGDNGPADGVSGSVTFNQGGLYASLAADSDVKNEDNVRFTAIYKFDAFQFGALYHQYEASEGDSDSVDGFGVNAAYKLGSNKLKAQFISSDIEADGAQRISLGLDHKLSKASKLYAHISQFTADADNTDSTRVGVGMETKF